ncbi:MAG: TIGR01777 family protein [Myxococcales bacterium]|nr:TIGR01777 family oxidoreductase [Myxococcales bacterium]MCB9715762.1 TIGR01777 family protein [Myxococcales bacterium]
MRVLMTGATGLVGRALALRLRRDGHRVTAWVRDPRAARAVLGDEVSVLGMDDDAELVRELDRVDVVVSLAGAPVAQRWTAAARRRLVESRVGLTHRLVDAMRRSTTRPRALVSASAVGYYGDRGDELLDEDSPPGEGFLARLCVDWEAAAREAEALGTRVCALRIGIVLDGEGGALATMRPAFAMGLGAVLGSGRQAMSFIHLHDLVELLVRAIEDERYRGPINAVAPEALDNRTFTRALARALGRPAWLRVPAFVLRLGMGQAAQILLHGQRVLPRRAHALGFRFRYPRLDDALEDAVDGGRSHVSIGPATAGGRELPPGEYVARRRPRYLLEQRTLVDAPRPAVLDFFRRAENLGAITPPALAFEIRTPTPIVMTQGRRIAYRIRLGPLPMRWLTRIEAWEPGERFVDVQLRGPYRAWYHEHLFEARGDRTLMIDRVWYAPPLGPLGAIAQRLVVAPMLRRIFGHRRAAIALRFGLAEDADDHDSLAA